jgi:hypothetical protein
MYFNKILPASSRVKWLKVDKTFSFPEDEDGDGPRNVGFIYF